MALALVGTTGAASASPVDLVCPGTLTLTASPGVTLIPAPSQFSGVVTAGTSLSPLTPCSSILSGTPYTGGSGVITGSGTVGCAGIGSLTGTASGTAAFTWNNGDTSAVAWDLTIAAPIPTITGTVTSGALVGSTVVVAGLVPLGVTGNCLFTPLTGLSVAGVGTVTRL